MPINNEEEGEYLSHNSDDNDDNDDDFLLQNDSYEISGNSDSENEEDRI